MPSTPELTENALRVLERRYLRKDESGDPVETPDGMFRRVARCVAEVDARYGGDAPGEDAYYGMMARLEFLPNSPTLMNAGIPGGQLSACFVIPVGDSIREIFGAVALMADIHQSGGGTGFSFSRLRPRNDIVGATGGVAAGPVAFMEVFDKATDVVKQGGRRRGANMGVLRVDHPDIRGFIDAKRTPGYLANFNLSVALTDTYMDALARGGEYPLVNPRTGAVTGTLRAGETFDALAASAWECGDPGVIFIDRVNSSNPTPRAGVIEATNPCGEQPLLPYESCNLGSINLSRFASGGSVDRERLGRTVRLAVRFLDNVIDANSYPDERIERATFSNRKVGLGVMGFAEMLVMLGIPYASDKGVETGRDIMRFISEEARAASAGLGCVRGSFPNFADSVHGPHGHMRNATVTTVAPTGTLGIIAGTSGGIEPMFAVAYRRLVMEGVELYEVNRLFLERARQGGYYTGELVERVSATGSVKWLEDIPPADRELFGTSLDIAPEWHIRMQAAFQEHTDNAVSKTVNLPEDAGVDAVRDIYKLAYETGCKGVTVFRQGCKGHQPVVMGHLGRPRDGDPPVEVAGEFDGECRQCST